MWWRDAISLREYKRPWCVPRWFYVKFSRSVSVSSASSALGSMCRVLGAREIDMLFLRLLTAHLHSPAKWYWVHGYFRLNRPRECVSYFARRITKHIDRPSSCPACLPGQYQRRHSVDFIADWRYGNWRHDFSTQFVVRYWDCAVRREGFCEE